MSTKSPTAPNPALLTSRSTRRPRPSVALNISPGAEARVRSASITVMSTPYRERSPFAKASSRSRERAVTMTFAPSAASLRAKASPIPYEAPVTSAVLPFHSDIAVSSENMGQDDILSHVFSSFPGEFCELVNDSSENVGQDDILSHVFSSFPGEFCELVNDSSENSGQWAVGSG